MLTLYRRPARIRSAVPDETDDPQTPEPAPGGDTPLVPEQPTQPERF